MKTSFFISTANFKPLVITPKVEKTGDGKTPDTPAAAKCSSTENFSKIMANLKRNK